MFRISSVYQADSQGIHALGPEPIGFEQNCNMIPAGASGSLNCHVVARYREANISPSFWPLQSADIFSEEEEEIVVVDVFNAKKRGEK